MITTFSKVSVITVTNKIFARSYSLSDLFKIVSYSTYLGEKKPPIMIIKTKSTVVIPLHQTDDELLMGTKSKTRNQIRKAMKDQVECEVSSDVEEFVSFYNEFAKEKGLPNITVASCLKYKDSIHLSKACLGNKTICYHANLIDCDTKRSLLLYSASSRLLEGVDRGMIGNANRYLHLFDLCSLRDAGMDVFDFGGIYLGHKDKAKMGIADFKQSFGGSIEKVVSYYSFSFYLLSLFRNLFH